MKKNLVVLLSVVALMGLTACESESYHTSETNIEVTTTTDSEPEAAETTAPEDTAAGEENKYDSDTYNLRYFVNDEGNFVVYVPEQESDYWRQITINDADNTMDFVADEVDEESVYYVELKPTIDDGTAQTIMGHFTLENEDEAVDFAIFDLEITGGKVTDILDSGFTDDLDKVIG